MKNRIKELRKELNMTQKDLGNKLNVSARSVGFYESGDRDPDTATLAIMSDLFQCSIDYLLFRTNKRKYDIDTLAFSTKLDSEGLSDEDIQAVQNIIDALKNKNK